jgi:PST family polysaccharide transporter
MTLYISVVCGLALVLFARYFSELILLDKQYTSVFFIFGITIILYSFNNLLNSILNGYKEFRKYVTIAIIGSIVGLVFSLVLVYFYHIEGALIGTVTYQSVIFFVTLFYIQKSSWFSWKLFNQRISKLALKKYLSYTLMTLTSAATIPVTQLMVRGRLMNTLSATEAGWWEAMNRLSGMYLMMVTTSFSIYYLPRLAELTEKKALKNEILTACKLILPILLISFTSIYFLRDIVIRILFSPDFYQMNNLFFWQLTGDFLKIASWLLAFLMIAKSKTRDFMISEILFSLSFVVLSFVMLDVNGVVGITQAYTINYFIYLIVMLLWVRHYFSGLA